MMKVKIVRVQPEPEAVSVTFSCCCGEGAGRWVGAPPNPGAEYFVEFDSDDQLRIGENARILDIPLQRVALANAGMEICGILDAVSEEETGRFRFGDGVIELDLADMTRWKVGQAYELQLRSLSLFDQNL